jgi:hypothetical protein
MSNIVDYIPHSKIISISSKTKRIDNMYLSALVINTEEGTYITRYGSDGKIKTDANGISGNFTLQI